MLKIRKLNFISTKIWLLIVSCTNGNPMKMFVCDVWKIQSKMTQAFFLSLKMSKDNTSPRQLIHTAALLLLCEERNYKCWSSVLEILTQSRDFPPMFTNCPAQSTTHRNLSNFRGIDSIPAGKEIKSSLYSLVQRRWKHSLISVTTNWQQIPERVFFVASLSLSQITTQAAWNAFLRKET